MPGTTKRRDPQGVPPVRAAATVAVLRDGLEGASVDGSNDLQVLLLRRHGGHLFGPNADVFPGGAVDAADATSNSTASVMQADLPGGRDFRRAAIREAFEEAGLLIGFDNALTLPPCAAVTRLREDLNAHRIDWAGVVAALGAPPDLSCLTYFAHWTTPAGAPKRYATRFFVTRAPADQQASPDMQEMVAAEWIAPAAALAQARRGQRRLMTPTRATLERLAGFGDVANALAGLAREAPVDA